MSQESLILGMESVNVIRKGIQVWNSAKFKNIEIEYHILNIPCITFNFPKFC